MDLKKKILNEGKSKIIYSTQKSNEVILDFKNDITAFNKKKKDIILNKGHINKEISIICFEFLKSKSIKNHFIKNISEQSILCKSLNIFQVEVVMRNVVAGSLKNRIGLKEKTVINNPICELYYKNDHLNDPLLNEEHILYLNLATQSEINIMKQLAKEINSFLKEFFLKANLILVDFKLEFGKTGQDIYLADEISPDTCRIWDKDSFEVLDKDRFRNDSGSVLESYEAVLNRLKNII